MSAATREKENEDFFVPASHRQEQEIFFDIVNFLYAFSLRQIEEGTFGMNDARGGFTCPRSNLFSDEVILFKWFHQTLILKPFIDTQNKEEKETVKGRKMRKEDEEY